MTYPGGGDNFVFQGAETPRPGESVVIGDQGTAPVQPQQRADFPPPILSDITPEQIEQLAIWVDRWMQDLESAQADKIKQWSDQEDAYRALPPAALEFEPFKGACRDVIPVGAMAVDPIHARLDTGIFKQDPVFTFKALKKSVKDFAPGLERFVQFYQRRYLKLRAVSSPRILECAKLGTMIFKTVYDRDENQVLRYDDQFKVVKTKEVRFVGPRVLGVSLGDALFPSNYQTVQDCPVFFERQRTTVEKLKVLEASGKLTNVDKIKQFQVIAPRTTLEEAREKAVKVALRTSFANEIVVHEGWCDYDINGDGLPEHLVLTYHRDTRTFLQIRLNWYFHQRKPYTLIPYTVVNDSLWGMGILEMVDPFQKAITRWHRMASDNAYLANIRMFIARKNSGIEQVPRLYTGRVFFVDEPTKDFIPFAIADIYPSTLAERQNLFGMVEKRTGVSDYLVGRESPIIGTRATATSTLALIQEGTRRVEEVLENFRNGFSEIMENCLSIWIQYGTGGLEDLIFADDVVAAQVKEFFANATQENVNGAFAIDVSATDASMNRQAQQQMQLALIQIMMQYLEKVLQAGQGALQAIQLGVPQYAMMVGEVMKAAREMFGDLLKKYDIPNAEDYLPDLEKYLNGPIQAAAGAGGGNGAQGQPAGPAGGPGVPVGTGPARGPAVPVPAVPGSGAGSPVRAALAGASSGVP